MSAWFKRLALVAVFVCLASVGESHAGAYRVGRLSTPYSSFNVSGVNYGSQQWNKQHAKTTTVKPAATRLRVRR